MRRKIIQWTALATFFALVSIAAQPLLSVIDVLVRMNGTRLHRPQFFWAMAITCGVLMVIAVARGFRRVWDSSKLGMFQLGLPIWGAGVFAFWILLEFQTPSASFATIVASAFAAYFIYEYQNRPITSANSSPQVRIDPDLPLPENGKDLLGRTEIVDTLTSLILLERPSIIGLTGGYGDGKTSILNLASGCLSALDRSNRPIIVRFNPWLPVDSDALVLSLLSAISAKITSEYFVPSFGKRALQYSGTLLGIIPHAKNLKDFFKQPSQQQKIRLLAESIRQLPRRIVVILDDLDRMQADELETIFKVLRGSEEFTNITFVCSYDVQELASILSTIRVNQDPNSFLEKFFPTVIPLPKIDSEVLKAFLYEEIKAICQQLELSLQPSKALDELWHKGGQQFFTNLRRIKRFINKLAYSLSIIGPEVNLLDFMCLELIRDIYSPLYEAVFKNIDIFSNTD